MRIIKGGGNVDTRVEPGDTLAVLTRAERALLQAIMEIEYGRIEKIVVRNGSPTYLEYDLNVSKVKQVYLDAKE